MRCTDDGLYAQKNNFIWRNKLGYTENSCSNSECSHGRQTQAPIPHDLWTSPPKCDHDWQPDGRPNLFMCQKCRRMEYAHMLEQVDGVWRMKEIKVGPWKRRR
jgi:hypothetical protein